MKPIIQTRTGSTGNCFAACLASILEIPLEDIPEIRATEWPEARAEFNAWLVPALGFYIVDVEFPPEYDPKELLHGYTVMSGTSPTCTYPQRYDHAVVALCGEMVHDPHPMKPGLKKGRAYTTFTLLVPVNPSRRLLG